MHKTLADGRPGWACLMRKMSGAKEVELIGLFCM